MTLPTFGQWLTTYLRDNEVKQTVFAQQLGVSAQYVNDIVRDRRSPSRMVVDATARVTGTPVDVLSVLAGLCPPTLQTWSMEQIEMFFATNDSTRPPDDGMRLG